MKLKLNEFSYVVIRSCIDVQEKKIKFLFHMRINDIEHWHSWVRAGLQSAPPSLPPTLCLRVWVLPGWLQPPHRQQACGEMRKGWAVKLSGAKRGGVGVPGWAASLPYQTGPACSPSGHCFRSVLRLSPNPPNPCSAALSSLTEKPTLYWG